MLRRGSRWGDQGWLSRQADAFEVAAYSGRLGERCDDAQAPSVCGTNGNVDVENSGEECGQERQVAEMLGLSRDEIADHFAGNAKRFLAKMRENQE